MAAELITPLDYETGIPLPILPTKELDRHDPTTNWHHAWHANSAPELQGVGGRALRHSRVQLVRNVDHNHGNKEVGKLTYHDYYVGPPLPTDDDERYKLCIISAAGYVPDMAIDLWSGDGPSKVRMTAEQKAILQLPDQPRPMLEQDRSWVIRRATETYGRLEDPSISFDDFLNAQFVEFNEHRRRQAAFGLAHIVYQYDPLRAFLQQEVLSQDLSHIREVKVEEFLLTKDPERKLRLGRWLLGEAVRKSTAPIQEPYKNLHAAGKLHPRMPKNVSWLVLWKLGAGPQRSELVANHEAALKASLGVA